MMQHSNQSNSATLQFEKNCKEFIQSHPLNYRNADVKGKLFDNINYYQGKVCCFPVKSGCSIKADDIILLDKYCEAFKLDDPTVSDEERLYSELAGTALDVVTQSNNQSIVFVRGKTLLAFDNTDDKGYVITENDLGNACYLESNHTVTRNESDYAFAGQIVDIKDNIVTVFISLEWRF